MTIPQCRGGYPVHPYAEMFPALEGEAKQALLQDLKENGQQEPVVLWQGKVLDGRTRQALLVYLKQPVKYREFRGDDDKAFRFALSANLHRRHLTDQQRAMVAARAATLKPHRPAAADNGAARPTLTVGQAATLLDVPERQVKKARRVEERGTKALKAALQEGLVTLEDAYHVARYPAKVQDAAVEKLKAGKAETLAKAAGVTVGGRQGAVAFDWGKFEEAFGKLVRLAAALGRAYPAEKASREYRAVDDNLRAADRAYRLVKKRVTKA